VSFFDSVTPFFDPTKYKVCVQGAVIFPSLRCLRHRYFQWLSSGGIPAPSAFSREKHAGAAVSPTAKSLKIRSDSANTVTGKQLPPWIVTIQRAILICFWELRYHDIPWKKKINCKNPWVQL